MGLCSYVQVPLEARRLQIPWSWGYKWYEAPKVVAGNQTQVLGKSGLHSISPALMVFFLQSHQ